MCENLAEIAKTILCLSIVYTAVQSTIDYHTLEIIRK